MTHKPLTDKVLTPTEAADLLDIPVEVLLSEAERSTIPGVRLGGHWRFTRNNLQRHQRTKIAA